MVRFVFAYIEKVISASTTGEGPLEAIEPETTDFSILFRSRGLSNQEINTEVFLSLPVSRLRSGEEGTRHDVQEM